MKYIIIPKTRRSFLEEDVLAEEVEILPAKLC
jgi:hypothetical protein